jgi:hypothetical protein
MAKTKHVDDDQESVADDAEPQILSVEDDEAEEPAPKKKKSKATKPKAPTAAEKTAEENKKVDDAVAVDGEIAGFRRDDIAAALKVARGGKALGKINKAKFVAELQTTPETAQLIADILKKERATAGKRTAKKRVRDAALASEAVGYGKLKAGDTTIEEAAGIDHTQTLISVAEAKKLVSYMPGTPSGMTVSEDVYDELLLRKSVVLNTDAAKVAAAHADAAMRQVINAATELAVFNGKTTVKAAHVAHVIASLVDQLQHASMPEGVVAYAGSKGIIDADNEKIGELKAAGRRNATAHKKFDADKKAAKMAKKAEVELPAMAD